MDKKKNDKENADAIHTYLSFQLGNETFAANVTNVVNILEMKPITEVPQSPNYIKGVINLRGNVLPVADMRIKFGLPEIEVNKDTCILVLHINVDGEDVMLGALVDSVKEVLEIEESKIEPTPSIGTKYRADFIQGMWMIEEDFIMLLDMNKIFSVDEVIDLKSNMSETSDIA
jgi:purine-binding chemotaxis protein CheW